MKRLIAIPPLLFALLLLGMAELSLRTSVLRILP